METQTGFLLELLLGSWAASGFILESFWAPSGLLGCVWAACFWIASGLLLGCLWAQAGRAEGPGREEGRIQVWKTKEDSKHTSQT
jgi:hypothetical protein